MITLSDLFWYGDGAKWGLRGDPHLWRDFRIAINYEPIPQNVDEFERCLYRLFHRLTGMELNPSWYDIFYRNQWIERYGHMGMSGGYVSHSQWKNTLFPLLKKRFNAMLKKHGGFCAGRNAFTDNDTSKKIVVPTGFNIYNYATGIKGERTLFVISSKAEIPNSSAEKGLISRIITLCKYFGYDSYVVSLRAPTYCMLASCAVTLTAKNEDDIFNI